MSGVFRCICRIVFHYTSCTCLKLRWPNVVIVAMWPTGDLPGVIATGAWTHRARRDLRKRQTAADWQVASVTSKGTYSWGLSWATTKWVDFHTCPPDFKSYIGAITGFSHIQGALTGFGHVPSPDILITPLLSQGFILGAASGNGEGKQNAHSKNGFQKWELILPGFSLRVKPAVVFCWWPPTTIIHSHLDDLWKVACNIKVLFEIFINKNKIL